MTPTESRCSGCPFLLWALAIRIEAWTGTAAPPTTAKIGATSSVSGLARAHRLPTSAQCPTLVGLLTPLAQRPQSFWCDRELYDPQRIGLVVAGAAAKAAGTKFDTRLRGNGSGSGEHDFGTGLSSAEKTALIEYLKSL